MTQLETVLKDVQIQLQQQRSAQDETFSDEMAAMNNEIAVLKDSTVCVNRVPKSHVILMFIPRYMLNNVCQTLGWR